MEHKIEQGAMTPRELLVIDDEPMLCKALGALFTEKGFRVTTAGTAREALDRVGTMKVDVVLLDLKLPDGSGLDVLSTLKARFPNLRVVVISGIADEPMIQEAMQRGASDYLAKPFDFDHCFYVAMGLETVDLSSAKPEPEALARVDAGLAKQQRVLPLRWDGTSLHAAVDGPLDAETLETLRAQLGCPVIPVAVTAGDLDQAIRRCYANGHGTTAASTKPAAVVMPAGPPAAVKAPNEVTGLIHELIVHAYTTRATDLHLGTSFAGPWVRERIDGALSDVPVSSKFVRGHRQVFSAIKGLAKLEPAEQGLPQQGRFGFDLDGIRLDVRVSVLPTAEGESLAVRLKEASRILPLDQLGLLEEQQQQLAALLSKTAGLLLVTGPSGSGKSTTLYTCLAKLNTGRVNIITVEDQVEQVLPGLTQIPVQTRTGLTFADGLRSIADHDPDVVMVGEMSNQETASLTVRTALTGHLVLSTLYTNDASSAVTRLLDLGIEPFFLCQTLSGVLAQRLVRKLCVACREPSDVEASSLVPLGIAVPRKAGAVRLWRPRGCKRCRQTGYHGRTGVFELLAVDHHIRSLMIRRTSGAQIRQSAMSRGMVSLAHAFWRKVATGETSLAELSRILPPELR